MNNATTTIAMAYKTAWRDRWRRGEFSLIVLMVFDLIFSDGSSILQPLS
jgi:hypothetical protein